MKKILSRAFLCSLFVAGPLPARTAGAQSAPFRVEPISALPTAGTIYRNETAGVLLVRDPQAAGDSFSNLYVADLQNTGVTPQDLELHGPLLYYHSGTGSFAVTKMERGLDARLAGRLYREGNFNGTPLLQLDGSPLIEVSAQAPTPVHPVENTLPAVESLASGVAAARIQKTVEQLAQIHTRYHRSDGGKEVPTLLAALYQEAARGRPDVRIETFEHESRHTPQKSLIARIVGQKNPNEIVVVGSHIDSINQRDPYARSPGADDDASGTAINLELFRLLMERGVQLDRTLEIHGYAAEEAGLVGSQEIARSYVEAGKAVISMLQNDMNLYSKDGKMKIWLVSSNTSDLLNEMLGRLISGYVGVPWEKRRLGLGSSDHSSWNRNGVHAAFPFEDPGASNPRIHTQNDTVEGASWEQAAAFARLSLAFAAHFAGIL
ncbi:MAG: M20/M25/M40 family metallo-hydrolase [Elusimicrobia bacterium]|nr:M20/M25/M40 family metallo-hydrolase [Elusimicrobiota bacterium]